MLSVLEVKRKLSRDFIKEIYEIYSPLVCDKILAGLNGERNTTLRVNAIKTNVQEIMKVLKENNIKFERVMWYKDGLILKNSNEKQINALKIYEEGLIYLQSLSSMIPPLVLEPKEGEKILDLTAAPGGKTTEIAALMNNNGYILANEIDKIRCERLKYNVEKQGASIIKINNGKGEKLGEIHKEEFDKILLDAPCSGEGTFLANQPKTYTSWSLRTVNELAKLQKKLIKSAYEALKPNGTMIYSTCTINLEEDEKIVDWAIKNLNLRVIDINLNIEEKNKLPITTENKDKSINKTIKIMPSKNMEGFYIAKLQKIERRGE